MSRAWRHTLLGAGFTVIGAALLGVGGVLKITIGGVLIALGLAIVAEAWNRRHPTAALFRLDHFLPSLKRARVAGPLYRPACIVRMARHVFPASWFVADGTLKPGKLRKWLQAIGPTVAGVPLRRAIQGTCFVAFLILFFHVCWPYTARPVATAAPSTGWSFTGIEEVGGNLKFSGGDAAGFPIKQGMIADLIGSDRNGKPIPLRLVSLDRETGGVFSPIEALAPEQLDALLLGAGPWTFSDPAAGAWPSHYADDLARKEKVPADFFLRIDPLVSLSTSIASRSWVSSLISAGVILLVCALIPRGFCGYLCPLGTLIDLFDWAIGKRVKRFRVAGDGWWVHVKYYILSGTLIAACFGVLISGFFSAIPVITRGLLFICEPLQTGFLRGWHLAVPWHWGHAISVTLFLGVLGLGLLRPRFWCKYVCPSGAVFSLANVFRISERKVEDSCIHCDKCVKACPFDAIKPDFTTRVTDCTLCQTCAPVCPTQSIKFVERWNAASLKPLNEPPTHEKALGRRGFVSLLTGSTAAIAGGGVAFGATKLWGANLDDPAAFLPVRPPGSVPEREFLQMCIRCGECFKACPNNVLHAEGFEQGFEGLWAPLVRADWAGCESSCNACGQVCPTGAIQPLPLEVKKTTRMGLAEVNLKTCLPHAGKEACQLCVDDCAAAGYHAIEFVQVHTETDKNGQPVEGSGFVAPVVLTDKCVGCGLCQTRCYGINVLEKGLLDESAIVIFAGPGKEDRRMPGDA